MNLIPFDITALPVGVPIPISLRNAEDQVVLHRGHVIESADELTRWSRRDVQFFVDRNEFALRQRQFVGTLHNLVSRNSTLGQIADTGFNLDLIPKPAEATPTLDWHDLQLRTRALLVNPSQVDFLNRLERLNVDLLSRVRQTPDAVLFALFFLHAQDYRAYSATHALLVHAICSIAARDVLRWPIPQQLTVSRVALTMNIAMTTLQDQLAAQACALTPAQREAVAQHADASADLLHRLGVDDPDWLDAVRCHHERKPGPLAGRSPAMQVARLVHRADVFSARLAPREGRPPMSSAAAMQVGYFAENKEVDEAGAALIKAVGVFSPGTFVRLNSGELAIVTRRGPNTAAPRVAVLVNRSGMPLRDPVLRDTAGGHYKIVAAVPPHEVKVSIQLSRMLELV